MKKKYNSIFVVFTDIYKYVQRKQFVAYLSAALTQPH